MHLNIQIRLKKKLNKNFYQIKNTYKLMIINMKFFDIENSKYYSN